MGASLLVFLNKTDMEHCMTEHEVREVSVYPCLPWPFEPFAGGRTDGCCSVLGWI